MQTSRPLVIAFFLILAFLPLRAAEEGKQALRADFEKVTAAFHQALRMNDPEGLFVYVAEDVAMMPPNEMPVRGKSAMQTWYRTFLSAFRTTTLMLSDREVTVSDSWATELGQYEWGLQPRAGGDLVVDKGNYMQIWKRGPDGSWRFFREIWNSSIATAPPVNK
jgi:ketosteroid isomerase-like protein